MAWNSSPQYITQQMHGMAFKIVLILQVESCEIIGTADIPPKWSDHAAMVATFRDVPPLLPHPPCAASSLRDKRWNDPSQRRLSTMFAAAAAAKASAAGLRHQDKAGQSTAGMPRPREDKTEDAPEDAITAQACCGEGRLLAAPSSPEASLGRLEEQPRQEQGLGATRKRRADCVESENHMNRDETKDGPYRFHNDHEDGETTSHAGTAPTPDIFPTDSAFPQQGAPPCDQIIGPLSDPPPRALLSRPVALLPSAAGQQVKGTIGGSKTSGGSGGGKAKKDNGQKPITSFFKGM